MKIRTGLSARLRLAKLAVVIPCGAASTPDVVALCAAGADLVLIAGCAQEQLVVFRELRELIDQNRVLLLTDQVASAFQFGVDGVVIESGTTLGERPPFRLVGERGRLESLTTDSPSDFWLVDVPGGEQAGTGQIAQLAAEFPPFSIEPGNTPWFVVADSVAEFDSYLAAGARRICLGNGPAGSAPPLELVRELKASLAERWRQDPGSQRYRFQAHRP